MNQTDQQRRYESQTKKRTALCPSCGKDITFGAGGVPIVEAFYEALVNHGKVCGKDVSK